MKIGAQLYTVRDSAKTLEDFAETLAKVADIGYTSVQVSGTCDYTGEWLAEELRKNGLSCPLTHFNPERMVSETEAVIELHKQFGCGVIGIGGAPGIFSDKPFDYDGFRDRFLPVALKLRDAGVLMGYHNHHPEFNRISGLDRAGDCNVLERIAADFPADALTFILDTYWVQYAGGDPAEWIRKLSGRVHCIHFKDMAVHGLEQRMAAIGDGNINFAAALTACKDAGTQYIFVEQDTCYGEDPFACLKRSYLYLKAQGLE